MGNLCCARKHSVQFFVQFFYTVKLHSLTYGVRMGPLTHQTLAYAHGHQSLSSHSISHPRSWPQKIANLLKSSWGGG